MSKCSSLFVAAIFMAACSCLGSLQAEDIDIVKVSSCEEPMDHLKTAKSLMAWVQTRLVADSDLKKEEIAIFFAPSFKVEANGRDYDANYDSYFEFLNGFRSKIKSIKHDIYRLFEFEDGVVMADRVTIARPDNTVQHYEVILILKFDAQGKIVLWHEVYVEVNK